MSTENKQALMKILSDGNFQPKHEADWVTIARILDQMGSHDHSRCGIQQAECFECTDHLNTPDFHGELVCPICYQKAKNGNT